MFRDQLIERESLIGTWVKTPSPIVVEVLAQTGLDVVCLDAEHAPFGRLELDACIHAGVAANLPMLVRVASAAPHHILQALDSGATGVVVPHVSDALQASEVVRSAQYVPGGRGYAGTTRAGGFGTKSMADHKIRSAEEIVVIIQIEDVAAVENIEEIVAVEGIDAVFIGPADLSVSMGAEGPAAIEVSQAIDRVIAAALGASVPVGIFANTKEQFDRFRSQGITLLLAQSDHAFLQAGARQLCEFGT